MALMQTGRNQEAAESFKEALKSDPENPEALKWRAFISRFAGHLDLGRFYLRRLLAVEPLPEGVNTEWFSFYSGDFDAAVDGYRVEYESDPTSPYTRWAYGLGLVWAGRTEEGCEIVERIAEESPETPHGLFVRFFVPAVWGDRDGALAAMTPELETVARREIQFSWMIGAGYAKLGMVDEALAWVRQEMDRGFLNYPFAAEHDPFLAEIRSEPRFQGLLTEMEQRSKAFEP